MKVALNSLKSLTIHLSEELHGKQQAFEMINFSISGFNRYCNFSSLHLVREQETCHLLPAQGSSERRTHRIKGFREEE